MFVFIQFVKIANKITSSTGDFFNMMITFLESIKTSPKGKRHLNNILDQVMHVLQWLQTDMVVMQYFLVFPCPVLRGNLS